MPFIKKSVDIFTLIHWPDPIIWRTVLNSDCRIIKNGFVVESSDDLLSYGPYLFTIGLAPHAASYRDGWLNFRMTYSGQLLTTTSWKEQ